MKKRRNSWKNLFMKTKKIISKHYIVAILALVMMFIVTTFTTTDIFKNGLAAIKGLNQQTTEPMPYAFIEENIPASMFELSGVSNDIVLDSNWKYVAGDVSASKFPKYDNYSFKSVTADGVPVTNLGIIEMPDGAKRYYYLTADGFEENLSVTILPDDMKFVINYAISEFNIEYDIKMSDNSSVPSEITTESIFGEGYATETVNRAYSFDVRIPNDYTARIYRYTYDENGNVDKLSKVDLINEYNKNNGYDLGTNTVYKKNGNNIVVDTENGPASRLMNETFYDNKVTENRYILVELTKNSNPPKFDAHFWLTTEFADGRGTVSESTEPASNGNLVPKFGNQWNWGDLANDDGQENLNKEKDGSYSYTWIFQTNSGSGGYILNALQINGVNLTIPFAPAEIGHDGKWNNLVSSSEVANPAESVKETVLPDGTVVTVTYVRAFDDGKKETQRVYEVKITNTYSDIYVTGGNFHQGTGAEEFITYSLIGVHADLTDDGLQSPAIQFYENNSWIELTSAKVEILKYPLNSGDTNHSGANVRFKLAEGYINPTYAFKDMDSKVINGQTSSSVVKTIPQNLEVDKIYGPDKDGWYYVRLESNGGNKISLLYVEATQMQYVVQYTSSNDVNNPQNMPNYKDITNNSSYDANGGRYYTARTNGIITINSNVPIDPNGYMVFKYWEVLDDQGNVVKDLDVYPSQALSLNDVSKYAIYDDKIVTGGVNVIRLRAKWEKVAEPFEYNVTFRYFDKNGVEHSIEDFMHINAKNIYDTGNTLTIGINADSTIMRDWLAKHPAYILDDEKNGSYVYNIENEETIIVYFEEKNGGLFLSKEVLGDKNDNNTYSFDLYNADIPDGTYIALPKGLNPEDAAAEDLIGVKFESSHATVKLKNKEGIVVYVPQGAYKIIETENENDDEYDVSIGGKATNNTSVEVKAGEVTEEIIVENTLTPANLTITIDQDPVSPAHVKAGEIITYTIIVKNDSTARAHDVVVTDIIPSGLINVKIGNISTGGARLDNQTVIWDLEDIEKSATETLIITAEVPEVTESTIWTNMAELSYTNVPKEFNNKSNSVIAKTIFSSLIVTNEVKGDLADQEKEFNFIVTLDDETINGTYGDMEFVDGIAEFTLKHGEQKIADGLFGGITYNVVEVEANKDGYITTSTDDSGMLEDGVIVKFVNSKVTIPSTLDDIVKWIVILLISMVGIALTVFYLRKKRKFN